jgi:hypothetical protein
MLLLIIADFFQARRGTSDNTARVCLCACFRHSSFLFTGSAGPCQRRNLACDALGMRRVAPGRGLLLISGYTGLSPAPEAL